MKLYKTRHGILATPQDGSTWHRVDADNWDELIRSADLYERVRTSLASGAVSAPADAARG